MCMLSVVCVDPACLGVVALANFVSMHDHKHVLYRMWIACMYVKPACEETIPL